MDGGYFCQWKLRLLQVCDMSLERLFSDEDEDLEGSSSFLDLRDNSCKSNKQPCSYQAVQFLSQVVAYFAFDLK